MDQTAAPPIELLEPVNLHLNIRRNLAASWYKKMVPVEIQGDLKPMKVGGGGAKGEASTQTGSKMGGLC